MAEDRHTGTDTSAGGDRRQGDRRKDDRRRDERRAPPPAWRRPWALVLYGVVATLVVMMVLNRSRPPAIPAGGSDEEIVSAAPGAPMAQGAVESPPPGPPQPARRPADHEQLMADGEAASGRLLDVELFCSSITQVALRNVDRVERPVAELADAGGRVPAAECKWGAASGADPRPDVLLLVPPAMAETFAAAPIVDDGFVRRRHVEAVAEWVGRSDALALRTTLVLRQYTPAPAPPPAS